MRNRLISHVFSYILLELFATYSSSCVCLSDVRMQHTSHCSSPPRVNPSVALALEEQVEQEEGRGREKGRRHSLCNMEEGEEEDVGSYWEKLQMRLTQGVCCCLLAAAATTAV